MGDPKVPEQCLEKFLSLIQNIDYISVRGDTTADYLSNLTGRDVVSCCDPTLLLDIEEWDKLISPEQQSVPYLLVYVIYAVPENYPGFSYAQELADKMNLPIKYIGYHFENGKPTFSTVSISEFLESFKNASFVITNTFHGVMFSLIYRRNFYVFTPHNSPTRIVDILSTAGLSERLIHSVDEARLLSSEIDYSIPNKKIEQFRATSLNWLKNALEE